MTEEKTRNDPKKAVPVPGAVEPGPVVSQAGPAEADAAGAGVPAPAAPVPLAQNRSGGWSEGNLPRRD
jgi:hypothetical protein